jgi:hypothetical protein
MMNWKGYGRKRLWHSYRYCPDICLDRLRKTAKRVNQDSPCPGLVPNRAHPEHKLETLSVGAPCSLPQSYSGTCCENSFLLPFVLTNGLSHQMMNEHSVVFGKKRGTVATVPQPTT